MAATGGGKTRGISGVADNGGWAAAANGGTVKGAVAIGIGSKASAGAAEPHGPTVGAGGAVGIWPPTLRAEACNCSIMAVKAPSMVCWPFRRISTMTSIGKAGETGVVDPAGSVRAAAGTDGASGSTMGVGAATGAVGTFGTKGSGALKG